MSGLFDMMAQRGHEQMVFFSDPPSGLRSIVCIHDSTLGRPVGGTRVHDYSTEEEAVLDVLRLSEGMTQKAAVSGCSSGGAKAIIWASPEDKSEVLLRSFGRRVHSFQGRFVTGTDVGTTYDDFVVVAQETPYVVALPEIYGGSGDTAEMTAFGTWHGIKACAQEIFGSKELKGLSVAIQGCGKVGHRLAVHLKEEGCRLLLSDVDEECVKHTAQAVQGEIVDPDRIMEAEVDILSPNALGGVLNRDSIPRLRCRIVAGAANNQLQEELEDSRRLKEHGILYAPDYVINAGGVIQAVEELGGYIKERALARAQGLGDLLGRIFEIARQEDISTHEAALALVKERIDQVGRINRIYLPPQ